MESVITIARQPCSVPGHGLPLNYLCLNPTCPRPQRLICQRCLDIHANCGETNKISIQQQASTAVDLHNKMLYRADIESAQELVEKRSLKQKTAEEIKEDFRKTLQESFDKMMQEIKKEMDKKQETIMESFEKHLNSFDVPKIEETYSEIRKTVVDEEPKAIEFLRKIESGEKQITENDQQILELATWRTNRNNKFFKLHQMSLDVIKMNSYFDQKEMIRSFLDSIPYDKLELKINLDWKWNQYFSNNVELSFDGLTATNKANETFIVGDRAMFNGIYEWSLDLNIPDQLYKDVFRFGVIEPHFIQDLQNGNCERTISMSYSHSNYEQMQQKKFIYPYPSLYNFCLDLKKGVFTISHKEKVVARSSNTNILGKNFIPFVYLPKNCSARIIIKS